MPEAMAVPELLFLEATQADAAIRRLATEKEIQNYAGIAVTFMGARSGSAAPGSRETLEARQSSRPLQFFWDW